MRRILAIGAILGVFAVRAAHAGDPPSPLSEADRRFFAWWDGLDYPDIGKLPFGNSWNGHWSRSGEQDPVQVPIPAWRVRESETTVDVLTLDLAFRHLEKRDIAGEPWNRRGFDPLDQIERATESALARQGGAFSWRKAVLARACAAREREGLAKRLLDAAQADGPEWPAPKSTGSPDRFEWVREQIARNALDALARSVGEERPPWSEILVEWDRAAKHFATAANRAELENGQAALRFMVADERERAKRQTKAWKDLADGERVPWLVHELQEAQDWILDGRISWEWGRSDMDPPAHLRLAELGLAAVPALLGALDDGRLTRMVDRHEASAWSMRSQVWLDVTDVLRVGDLAWHTLDQISGGVLASENRGTSLTNGRGARRAAAKAWFSRVGPLGEARALADAVRGGSPAGLEVAERLVKLDPALAVTALEAAATASKEGWSQQYAVQTLATISGDAASDALVRLIPLLTDPGSRIDAAAAAASRGKREGIAELVRTWKQGLAERGREPAPGAWSRQPTWWLALTALVASRDADALAALADGLSEQPPEIRSNVVARFVPVGPGESRWIDRMGHTGVTVTEPPPEVPFPEKALTVLESLLADRLEDAERTDGLFVTLEAVERDPPIGEIAAYALAKRFPDRWAFDAKAPTLERAKARVALANRRRAAQGKPPLDGPAERPAPMAIPYESLRADLERASGTDPAARKAVIEAVEARGLPALPAVRRAISSLEKDAAGRGDLVRLARRLSFIVTEATLTPDSAPADEAFRTALASGVSRRLTPSLYNAFLLFVTRKRPPNTFGLRLVAERLDAGRGVSIRATLFKEPAPRTEPTSWGTRWVQPVVHRRGKTSFGNAGWSSTEGIQAYDFEIWNAAIEKEIEASELDDDFLVDGRVEFER